MSLPVIRLSGTPYEQGRRHGDALQDRIARNLEVYFERFEREVGLSRAEVLARAEQYLRVLEAQDPEYLAGVRGIATGGDFPLLEVAALNVRFELLYDRYTHEAMGDGCTAFAVLPERAADGHLLMGQNWDWIPQVQGAVLHTRYPDGFDTVAFTEAGIFGGKIGFNTAGLGLAINGLLSTRDSWSHLRTPFHARCYRALRSHDLREALAAITATERSCSANFLLAQTPGTAVDIETAPSAHRRLDPADGFLAHANHFVDPAALGIRQPPLERGWLSESRHCRMEALLREAAPLTVEKLQQLLRDHQNHPNGICRHPDTSLPEEERSITVTSVVIDLTTRTMCLTDRQPCENAYQVVSLEG